MKSVLSHHERKEVESLVAETEKATGVQIVTAVIRRSDSYAELPWKAFALGASLAAIAAALLILTSRSWNLQNLTIPALALTLAGGAMFMLFSLLIPKFARCFLSADRAETEVEQYAKSLFLDRELFATRDRIGLLLLVSLFERRVILLPDSGLRQRLTDVSMQTIIDAMTPFLKRRDTAGALKAGLNFLSRSLETAIPASSDNEIPDEIIQEEGA